MKLEEVLPLLRKGKRITRPKYYGWYKKSRRKLIYTWQTCDTFNYLEEATFSSEDVLATDWEVLG
jgi:hypothetical protein